MLRGQDRCGCQERHLLAVADHPVHAQRAFCSRERGHEARDTPERSDKKKRRRTRPTGRASRNEQLTQNTLMLAWYIRTQIHRQTHGLSCVHDDALTGTSSGYTHTITRTRWAQRQKHAWGTKTWPGLRDNRLMRARSLMQIIMQRGRRLGISLRRAEVMARHSEAFQKGQNNQLCHSFARLPRE